MDDKILTMKFSPQSYKILQNLAANLNTTTDKVIGKALALLDMAQGRTVTLKDPKQGSFDINNFSNLPSNVKIEKK